MFFAAKKAYIKKNYDLDEVEEVEEQTPAPSRRLQRKGSFECFSVSSLNASLDYESGSEGEEDEDELLEQEAGARDLDGLHQMEQAVRASSSSSYELNARSSSPPLRGDFQEERKQVQPPQVKRGVKAKGQKDPNREMFRQKIDSNVVAIRMSCLQEAGQIATGDAVLCSSCRGALNVTSKLEQVSEAVQMWTCEFCEQVNEVYVEPEEFPSNSAVDYLLMSADLAADAHLGGVDPTSDISVIFCIDTSGSMCVTQPVQGEIKLKVKQPKIEGLDDFDMMEQFLPGDRGVTYISRMQCVQASIESQLEEMARACPERKVGIVTFSSDVTIIGDGTTEAYTLAGDKLNSFQACYEAGVNWQSKLTNKIGNCREVLTEKLLRIEESGPTALGPALLTAVGLASKGRLGSKVIICTDGLANVGLGNLADIRSKEDEQAAADFYVKVGEMAREMGIEVSVISIKGEACKLSYLSKVAELTSGEVNQVEPTNLAQDFANILSTPLIATKVSAVVKIHRGLMFRNADEDVIDQNTLRRDLGNVTADTEFTFEYYVRPKVEVTALGLDLEKIEKLTFQTQIHYTRMDGNMYMRVITATQEMTDDKEDAEKGVDLEVIGINAAQSASKAVKLGKIQEAKGAMRGWRNMIKRNVENEEDISSYNAYVSNLDVLQHEIRGAEQGYGGYGGKMDTDSLHNAAYRAGHANKKKQCVVW
jgi:hypothetical protein